MFMEKETSEMCNKITGLDLETARDLVMEAGLRFRITKQDGNNYIVTRDHRIDRINVHVLDNKIVQAKVG